MDFDIDYCRSIVWPLCLFSYLLHQCLKHPHLKVRLSFEVLSAFFEQNNRFSRHFLSYHEFFSPVEEDIVFKRSELFLIFQGPSESGVGLALFLVGEPDEGNAIGIITLLKMHCSLHDEAI